MSQTVVNDKLPDAGQELPSNGSGSQPPLTPKEIKIRLLTDEVEIQDLATQWSEKLQRRISPSVISRVINRRPGHVYQEVRELLAEYLGVPVSRIGNEPASRSEA